LELAEALKLSHPTILYHIGVLQDEGYVQTAEWGKRRCMFDTQAHFTAWERGFLMLLDSEAGRVFEYVSAHPGTFPREIARRLGVSETTVKRAVPELLRLGLLREERAFRKRLHVNGDFLDRAEALAARMPPAETRLRVEAIVAGERARLAAEEAAVQERLREESENRLVPPKSP
jgi:DNA-binding MarR family transcriptional regulator